jgi:CHAT domain-containing protein/tetratricopeptide (TPR) repeat protein
MATSRADAEAILRAFEELTSAITWPEIEQVLRRRPELLTPLADRILSALALAQDSAEARAAVEEPLSILRRAREVGLEAALREAQGPLAAIRAFVEADSHAKRVAVVSEHRELLDPRLDPMLDQLIEDQQDGKTRRYVAEQVKLLRSWRAGFDEGPAAGTDAAELAYVEGIRCRARYDQTGDLAALQDAIRWFEQCAAAAPRGSDTRLQATGNLGAALRRRYVRLGDARDLDRGIALLEEAARSGDPYVQLNYGNALLERYYRTASESDLELLIELFGRAMTEFPDAEKPLAMNNLGIGLRQRFIRRGNPADLERAIEVWEKGLAAARNRSPVVLLTQLLTNISTGYQDRFHRTGALPDIDAAIRASREAVGLAAPGAADRSMFLNNLGGQIMDRFHRHESVEDLLQAVASFGEAVQGAPRGSAEMPMFLDNLGNALAELHKRDPDAGHLDRAVAAHEEAVRITPAGSPIRARHISNLCMVLSLRGNAADRKRVVALLEKSIGTVPQGNVERVLLLVNLAEDYRTLAKTRWWWGRARNLRKARALLRQAAVDGLDVRPGIALQAAVRMGAMAFEKEDWSEVARAHELVLRATERLLAAQLDRESKSAWLEEAQGFPALAAYAFAKRRDYKSAVLALEIGRARLLAESLERDRAELESLSRSHPELARRYREAADLVATAASTGTFGDPWRAAREARKELDAAVEAIRRIPVHAGFLAAPEWSALEKVFAAQRRDRAIVYLLATSAGSLALTVQEGGIDATFIDAAADVLAAVRGSVSDLGLFDSIGTLVAPLATRLRETDVAEVVLIPIGALVLLPLHAARYGGRYFLDELTIQYAPSARSLAVAQKQVAERTGKPLLLAVANPTLRGAEAEVGAIEQLLPKPSRKILRGTDATRERVLARMGDATHLHFACHGLFDAREPLDSCLELSDGERLTLRDLLGRQVRPKYARLAVLSACETAKTDVESLPDEVIGLPAGFLEAGVPGVVGTLWPVDDFSTALVMIRFYELHLRGEVEPAAALQRAQQWLRDATAAEIAEFTSAHPQIAEALRESLRRGEKTALAAARHGERPFATQPFHWAPFVFFGA